MFHPQHDRLTGYIVGIVVSSIDLFHMQWLLCLLIKSGATFYHMTSLVQTFANVR